MNQIQETIHYEQTMITYLQKEKELLKQGKSYLKILPIYSTMNTSETPVFQVIDENHEEEFDRTIPDKNFIDLNQLHTINGKYTIQKAMELKQQEEEKKKMMKQMDNSKLKLKETLARRVKVDLQSKEDEEYAKREQMLLKEEMKRQQELIQKRKELMKKYVESFHQKNDFEKKPRAN